MARNGPKLVRIRPELAEEIDRQIGGRIRQRRIMLGLTQQQMAEQLGITYRRAKQLRAGDGSAARIYDIAQALSVDVGYFFEPSRAAPAETNASGRGMLELARNFAAISDHERQEAVVALVRSMAEDDAGRRRQGRRHLCSPIARSTSFALFPCSTCAWR